MREIKFRYWSDSLKVMYIPNNQIGNLWSIPESENGILITKENDKLMQYTGLMDREGNEIYEGDIIEANGSKLIKIHDYSKTRLYVNSNIKDDYSIKYGRFLFVCEWNNEFSCFDFKSIFNDISINSDVDDRDYKVIGNIYQDSYFLN